MKYMGFGDVEELRGIAINLSQYLGYYSIQTIMTEIAPFEYCLDRRDLEYIRYLLTKK